MTIADLSSLPVSDRWRAYDDFDRAMSLWQSARRAMQWGLPGWRLDHRLDLKAAQRAWKHYAKAVREAKTRSTIQAWEDHANACDLRGAGYAAEATAFPVSHRDHHHYLRLANEQCRKAAEARRWAEIERNSL